MNISRALPGSLTLEFQDEEWVQTIDYEHIPFRCRKCHEHGHLFRDCPQNTPARQDEDTCRAPPRMDFTQVQSRWKKNPKNPSQSQAKRPSMSNSFEILNQLSESQEVENPHLIGSKNNVKGKAKQTSDPILEQIDPPRSQHNRRRITSQMMVETWK
jgi:hypothetical protein